MKTKPQPWTPRDRQNAASPKTLQAFNRFQDAKAALLGVDSKAKKFHVEPITDHSHARYEPQEKIP